MKVFWTDKEISEEGSTLMQLCLDAHAQSAMRDNVSTSVLKAAAFGSGNFAQSLAAALCSLGGEHAPLEETYDIIQEASDSDIHDMIIMGNRIPGWGNSFVKAAPDPAWEPVDKCLKTHFHTVHNRVESITQILFESGRNVFPNPSCFTAATGLAVGMPKNLLSALFIHGRLNSWAQIFHLITTKV
jgi:citrate synthase